MQPLRDYFAMGGYAAFVWPAYGLAAAVMTGILLVSLRRYRRMQCTLEALQRSRPVRPRRGAAREAVGGAARR